MKTFKIVIYGIPLTQNDHFLQGVIGRVPCSIRGWLFDANEDCPIFIPDNNGNDVQAELLIISEAGLANMDKNMGYPQRNRREMVQVRFSDGTEGSSMIYLVNNIPNTIKQQMSCIQEAGVAATKNCLTEPQASMRQATTLHIASNGYDTRQA